MSKAGKEIIAGAEPASACRKDLSAKKNRHCSDAKAAIHDIAEGLFETGAIDKQTMHEFDAAYLVENYVENLPPERQKRIRKKAARYIQEARKNRAKKTD